MLSLSDLKFFAKYPFTPEAKDYIKSLGVDFKDLPDEMLQHASKRIYESITCDRASFRRWMREIDLSREPFLEREILAYPLSKVIIALSDNILLTRQFARGEAERVNYCLQFEQESTIYKIASKLFDIKRRRKSYAIHFTEYLSALPSGTKYKLVNQELDGGYVTANSQTLSRLISETVFQSIISTKVDKVRVPRVFRFYAEEIKKYKRALAVDLGPLDVSCFPPCIKYIIADLRSGEKVSHTPRFVLVTFLAAVGMDVDQAIEIFRHQPNFNEKRTRYHIEHAYGLKGRTKYSPPSCEKMRSYGICQKSPECRWKHPVSFYKAMKRKKVKGES